MKPKIISFDIGSSNPYPVNCSSIVCHTMRGTHKEKNVIVEAYYTLTVSSALRVFRAIMRLEEIRRQNEVK